MTYDKTKKARADAARYQRKRDFLLAQKRARRLANKPVVREGNPAKEELRWCIEQGYCWWCQRGGWRRLAQHTAMAHQIYANDVRKIAVMLKRKPTCVKEESETMSDNRRRAMALGHAKAPDWRLAQGTKHEYSEAGLISMRENQKHMMESITPEMQAKAIEASIQVTAKPHPCPICGKMIPRAKPRCCSEECAKQRQQVGLEIGHRLWHEGNPIMKEGLAKGQKLWNTGEYREKMLAILDLVRQKPKTHRCRVCGKLIRKSRPRAYCSSECAHNPFNLPIDEIKDRYLAGESSLTIAKSYDCCDHTIRRQLRKVGIAIRPDNSSRYNN